MEYAIGIDLGGTFIKYALIDANGNFLFSGKLPSHADQSPQAVINQLVRSVEIVNEYLEANGGIIKGIGIGTPGIIDSTNRVVVGGAENIKGWANIPLSSLMEQATHLPTILSNDANLMGLGEAHYGAGRGCTDVVFLTVGTGIGGAVIIGGKLFNGFGNRGTELGHTPLIVNGEPCACGSVGCLETYASAAALVKSFMLENEKKGIHYAAGEINGETIVELYHSGDLIAKKCLDDNCYYLGRGIAGFINIFSPEKVVIGGGLSEAGQFYIDKVRTEALRHAIPESSA
ncbi:MAG: ROK family protein, partial [Bacteroidaceae bacterium]